jgi:uncharacterized tellurite resistance protein B-like protein
MFKKEVKSQNTNSLEDKSILIASLLVHAARIDENYTDVERKIIKSALLDLMNVSENKVEELLKKAEKKEEESNQIVEFTKEIKSFAMESRLKIIEVIWKIVYSDDTNDNYESNLIRRVCGLLYVSDKDNGIIKNKVKNLKK